MERPLWDRSDHVVAAVPHDGSRRVRHGDRAIVAAFLRAVLRDRPASWPEAPRPAAVPARPTMSRRRLRAPGVLAPRNAPTRHFSSAAPAEWVKFLDAEPPPVGGFAKDRDAAAGRGAGGRIVGSELHAIRGRGAAPRAFEVLPADRAEPVVARASARRLGGAGYLVGDAAYDSNPLHRVCAGRGRRPVAPPKERDRGPGHHRQEPQRRHAPEMRRRPFGRAPDAERAAIERRLGNLTAFGGGLGPLPAWVRRPWRVRRRIQAELLIDATRIEINHRPHAGWVNNVATGGRGLG